MPWYVVVPYVLMGLYVGRRAALVCWNERESGGILATLPGMLLFPLLIFGALWPVLALGFGAKHLVLGPVRYRERREAARAAQAKQRVRDREAALSDLREQRDEWKRQVERVGGTADQREVAQGMYEYCQKQITEMMQSAA